MDERCQPSSVATDRFTPPPARYEITPIPSITPPDDSGKILPRRHGHDRVRVHETANDSR